MWRRMRTGVLVVFGLLALYLLLWPVPVDPAAWAAPADSGYTGVHAVNTGLAALERVTLPGGHTGPEAITVDSAGQLYVATHEGAVLRYDPRGGTFSTIVETGGRPLGLEIASDGTLWIADAYRGLLSFDMQAGLRVRASEAEGVPIAYADDLDVTSDGFVYLSDASTRFGAKAYGGTFPASLLAIMEHSGDGRLLEFDSNSETIRTVADGLTFPNGVARTADGSAVLFAETGSYRVLRYHRFGPRKGTVEPVLENLPGFPDNVQRDADGRFWVGLVSSRRPALDAMANRPFVRKIVQRLPPALRPKATRYGHVILIDEEGKVHADLQDPSGAFAQTTGGITRNGELFVTSLTEPAFGRLPWPAK